MIETDEGFEEIQAEYVSASQRARIWTERWAEKWLYCPNCGNPYLSKYPNNRPVADFYCPDRSCKEEFELKSQRKPLSGRVTDGAYRTMRERIASINNPNFVFLRYSLQMNDVIELFIVPKQFFVPEVLEKRKPLSDDARRKGWIGCNILIDAIPQLGKIYLVRDRQRIDKSLIMTRWQRTLSLRDKSASERSWLIEVMACIESMDKREFRLGEVYKFEERLKRLFPNNNNVKAKIRQQLQFLRNQGYLEFVSRGHYRLQSQR